VATYRSSWLSDGVYVKDASSHRESVVYSTGTVRRRARFAGGMDGGVEQLNAKGGLRYALLQHYTKQGRMRVRIRAQQQQ
jgi:hypothetical protein